jgi:hypothetical protein
VDLEQAFAAGLQIRSHHFASVLNFVVGCYTDFQSHRLSMSCSNSNFELEYSRIQTKVRGRIEDLKDLTSLLYVKGVYTIDHEAVESIEVSRKRL